MRSSLAGTLVSGVVAALAVFGCVGPPDPSGEPLLAADLRAAGVPWGCRPADLAAADEAVPVADVADAVAVLSYGAVLCVTTERGLPADPAGPVGARGLGESDRSGGAALFDLPVGEPPTWVGADQRSAKSRSEGGGSENPEWAALSAITSPVKDPTPQPATPAASTTGLGTPPVCSGQGCSKTD
ncbi:MAG: hypothetical protein QME96_13825 [Myxococcota bacterium]|nr:hypothetical protein [Myxococcota bacterium]